MLDDWDLRPAGGSGQAWVLKALREAGNSLVSEMYGVEEDLLCRRPAEDELCLTEIAAHVRDAEELALRQMTAIAEGEQRSLPAWDVDLLPFERDYREEDVEVLLTEFRGLRRETTALLWSVADDTWHAAGRHPWRGDVTLGQIAHELAQHDLEHLWQVRQLKHELGAVTAGGDDDWW
jgi:hypothetical protein